MKVVIILFLTLVSYNSFSAQAIVKEEAKSPCLFIKSDSRKTKLLNFEKKTVEEVLPAEKARSVTK